MPLTDKQREYLQNCNHRWNVKTGATGSGKSFLDFTVTIPKRITACRGEGLIVLLGNTRGTLERNILEPMRQWWPGNVGMIRSDNTVDLFGKKVYALGADNKKHVSRIQGATFEYVYGDEVTTWSEDVFQMLKSRLRCEHSHFDGTCNPDNPEHWFKKFLDSDADIYQQSYVIDDGVLPNHIVAELKKEYAGTVFYDRYILGKWAQAEGLIYSMVNENNFYTDAERPLSLHFSGYRTIVCDYGTVNPCVFYDIYDYNDVSYIDREYRWDSRKMQHQKTDEEYADDMMEFVGDKQCTIIVDPSAASFIEALLRRGLYVLGANNDVIDGIRKTGALFQKKKLLIHESCKGLKSELSSYSWDPKSTEDKPLKQQDHGPDAIRYYVNSLPDWRV